MASAAGRVRHEGKQQRTEQALGPAQDPICAILAMGTSWGPSKTKFNNNRPPPPPKKGHAGQAPVCLAPGSRRWPRP